MLQEEQMTYEEVLVYIMRDYGLTLQEAIEFDLDAACIDKSSVFAICDYMEEQLEDLDKVQYYMMVYTGQEPDLELKEGNEK